MGQAARGILAMLATCTIWGLSPLYYRLLTHVPAPDILAHRTLWSLLFFAAILIGQGRLPALGHALSTRRRILRTALASGMIATNWLLFIWAIQVERVTETSLGYYIFPLVSVALGGVLFAERLSRPQTVAVGLAALAVTILTIGLGVAPWISLTLAVTFAIYGALKKQVEAGPVVSVTSEIVILAPVAILWLSIFAAPPPDDLTTWSLLIGSGPMTAIPLILFSYASRRIRLSTLGLLQYVNPTLQFLVAVLILSEPSTLWHAIAFPLIWLALAIYSVDAVRSASRAAATSPTT